MAEATINPPAEPAVPSVPPQVTPPTEPPVTPPAEPEKGMFAKRFNSVEEMEKGYLELHTEYSRLKQGIPSEQPPVAPEPGTGDPPKTGDLSVKPPAEPSGPMNIDGILAKAGVDQKQLTDEWTETGRLSDETYKKFESKLGFDRSVVDGFIGAQQIKAQEMFTKASQIAGGEAQLEAALDHAGASMSKVEMDNINSRLADPMLSKGAVTELIARHNMAVGHTPGQGLIDGSPTPANVALPTTLKEFNTLSDRVRAGDQQAARVIDRLTQDQISKLK